MAHNQPPQLPILPLPHPFILFPGATISVPISKTLAKSLVRLINETEEDAVAVAAVPILTDGLDGVNGKLSEWGCAARIVRIVRPPALQSTSSHLITLQGTHRVQLVHSPRLPPSDYSTFLAHSHSVSYPPSSPSASTQSLLQFRRTALDYIDRIGNNHDSTPNPSNELTLTLRPTRKDAYSRLRDLIRDSSDDRIPWIADLIVAVIGADFEDRLAYLATPQPEQRLQTAVDIIAKKVVLMEINETVSKNVEETVTKQQREFYLRQQKAVIDRELATLHRERFSTNTSSLPISSRQSSNATISGPSSDLDDEEFNDQDDLSDLKAKISSTFQPGTEERKLAVREYKRLKRSPTGSVEGGVLRNYLEWLIALPWDNGVNAAIVADGFLEKAREQLERDHFGLEKIKRRLLEYLAVVRLKEGEVMKEREKERSVVVALKEDAVRPSTDDALEKDQLEGDLKSSAIETRKPMKKVINKGPILLLHGPPGVGKTSIAQSLAKALDRPFQRISLGGVRDEAEIRGHRRTYVASGPGNIVQALKKAGRLDPVILLDEIDKISQANFHGDPAAALLEVLDPEQNWSFMDHYINTPIDLSQVTFIATANSLDTISAPLLDRCEVVKLSGYTHEEKLVIARKWLIPKVLKQNGFDEQRCSISDDVLARIVDGWTREAGVRGLQRELGGVVRWKVVQWSEPPSTPAIKYDPVVHQEDLEMILGLERFSGASDEDFAVSKRGVVYGLVVMGEGYGGVLPVETAIVPGSGKLTLTGSLGEVIRESAEIALAWVKANAYTLGITPTPSHDPLKHPHPIDIHLHLPAGAQKKDGPSAGIAMACAFISLLSGEKVKAGIAMTGEISLRGNVLPVGGIKEKVLGAGRSGGVKKVLVPRRNRREVEEDVFGVKGGADVGVEVVFVGSVWEVLEEVFEEGAFGIRRNEAEKQGRRIVDVGSSVESRL